MNKNGNKLKELKSQLGLWRSLMGFMVVCLMISTTTQIIQAGAATSTVNSKIDDTLVLQKSITHLQKQAQIWGIRNVQKEFLLKRINWDNLGQVHARLVQSYDGIPVFGRQLDVHMDGNGNLLSVTGNYLNGINVNVKPSLTEGKALEFALKQFSGNPTNIPDVELMLYPMDKNVVLVYRVALEDFSKPTSTVAFIDANTGEIVESYDNLQTPVASSENQVHTQAGSSQGSSIRELNSKASVPSLGVGKSMYSGEVIIDTLFSKNKYIMLDKTKGIGIKDTGYMRTSDMNNRKIGSGTIFSDADNTWGNFLATDRVTSGVDAQFGAEMTWDYYFDNWGRKGIFNDGKGTLSKVHYGINYSNAFWDGSTMTYGDGDGVEFTPLVSLDVAGHEMTHGVTQSVAGLVYSGQSGGLNEAMSDIFGTMVEFYAFYHGTATTPDYLIGEDIYTPAISGDALRYMNDPTRDGVSIDNFQNYKDGINVHYSSGIANKAFYLLSEDVNIGIGNEKAANIFFRALDVYMVPSETFSQARTHTIQAAKDLYGITSPEVTSVGQAWTAVGVV